LGIAWQKLIWLEPQLGGPFGESARAKPPMPGSLFFRPNDLSGTIDKMLLVYRERSSLRGDIAGTRSQTTLIETRIGTDNKAPGTPQSHIQKIKETKMTTGLRVNRRPSNTGIMKFASSKWSSRYQAGGRSPVHSVSKVSSPTAASKMTPATGPTLLLKYQLKASISDGLEHPWKA